MSYSIYDTIYINSSTGKVGIGTTLSADDKLTLWSPDIAGIRVQSFTDYAWSIYANSNNTQGFEIGVNAANDPDAPGYGYLWTYDDTHGIHFGTSNTERMRIEPNGDIKFGDYFSIPNPKNISFILQDRLQADDAAGSESFGNAVAISADGNTLAVGCILDTHSGGVFAGSVFIFTRTNSIWTQQARLQASDAAFNDWFGFSVAISSDGNTLAIGSVQDDNSGGTDAGSAYIFTRSGSSWSQQARLQASDAAALNAFGWAITISSDGNTVAVSAVFSTSSFLPAAGSVYVFTRSGSIWTQQARLQAGDPGINDQFGYSVALSPDSNTLAVGSWLDDNSGGTDAGSVYIFTRSGSVWTQQARLQASDALTRNQFGFSVGLSIDGNILAVGANRHYNEGEIDSGSVYIFRRTDSVWTEEIRLKPSDAAQEDYFGRSVSISSDGNTLAVGAVFDDNSGGIDAGAAYVFMYENSTWTQVSKLVATDPNSEDWFGLSIALSADALTLAVGANRHDNSGGTDAGSVFVFTNKFMGVIGIGTTDPLSKIHIYYDDIPKADLLRVDSYNLTTPFVVNSGGNVGIGTTEPLSRLHIYYDEFVDLDLFRIDNISYTNSFIVDYAGYVGIGTTQPITHLHIDGQNDFLKIYDFIYQRDVLFINIGNKTGFGTNSPEALVHIQYDNSLITPEDLFKITNKDFDTTPFFVNYDGYVGIGTTNPISQLHISQETNGLRDDFLRINDYMNNKEILIVKDSGNVGIGTTEPLELLHVNGSFQTNTLKITGIDDLGIYGLPIRLTDRWIEQAKVEVLIPEAGDNFGNAVSVSNDGNIAVIGAYLKDTINGTDAGSVSVFRRNNSTWEHTDLVIGSSGTINDRFGVSVAISGDGSTIAVGSYFHDNSGGTNAGSVYIYIFDGNSWVEEDRVQASDAAAFDRFGYSVALSYNGDILAVGSYYDDVGPITDAGSVYIFSRSNSTWTEDVQLTASDGNTTDRFGSSIALSSLGTVLAVGAPLYDTLSGGADAGSVYVFRNDGFSWTEEARLEASDTGAGDRFGISVSLSSLGNVLAVGAQLDDNTGGTDGGSVYIFRYDGTTWNEETWLEGSDVAADDRFGISVSLSGDGTSLAVGAYYKDATGGTDSGSVYIFTYDGSSWNEQYQLEASDGAANDHFGYAIALSGDGHTLVVGSIDDDTDAGVDAGSAYIFVHPQYTRLGIGIDVPREKLDIDGTIILSGNIGIGTTSPIVSLHVEKTDSILLPKGSILDRPSGVKGLIRYNTELDQFEGFGAGNTWGSLGGVKSIDQQTYITAENDSNLRFYTGGVERMIFNPNGNLGIGTTDPIVSLHVERTDSILLPKGTSTERPTGVTGLVRYNTELNQFEGFGAGNAWGSLGGVKSTDQSTYITAENDSNIRFFTSTMQHMILNSNGNLGIGTNNPIEKFHLTGNMLIEGNILPSACNVYSIGSSNFRFKDIYLSGNTIDLGGTLISRDSLTGRISFRSTGGTENDKLDLSVRSILVDNSVGIGTHIATQAMHVQGNLYASGSLIASNLVLFGETLVIDTVTSNANQVIIENMGSGPALKVIQEGNNSVAEFYDKESGIALFIENNGLIGIQTSAPTEALHVQGTILSTAGYRVNGTVAISSTLMHYVDSSRGIRNVTGQYGTVQTTGEGVGNWEGYSIDGRYVFMSSDNNTCGLYNDIDNQWMLYFTRSTNANGTISLYYAGTEKLSTTSTGISVSGNILFGTGANKGTLTYPTNAAATFTIPNVGNADFVMTAGNQSIGGLKVFPSNVGIGTTVARDPLDVIGNARVSGTLSSGTYQINGTTVIDGSRNVTLGSGTFTTTGSISSGAINTGANNITTNNLVFGTQSNKGTLTYTTNTARTFTIPDPGANANFVMTEGSQTINGVKTFGSTITGNISGNAGTVTNGVYTSRTISTSTGLSGGGDLSTDRTLSIDSTVFYSGGSVNGNLRFTAGDGTGVRFWDSDSYKIWMSASGNATWGGRLDGDSDYNMYFRMTGGTNRGFVFKNSTTNIAQIRGNGDFYFTGTLQQGTIPNARTTATSANTANSIITRDGSGNFTAGTMTGNLSGTATNATNVTITNDTSTNAVEFITFVGANSGNQAINTNSSQLTFNPSTGSVGIGTTVPRQKLDVVGTISASSFSGSFSGNITGTATAASSLTSGATITPWGATFDTAWGSQPSITFPSGNTQLRLHSNTGQCDFWVDGLVNTLVGVQLNGTTVIDSSRNLTNIVSATVSSGISITGGLAANTWIGASVGGAGGTNVVVIGNLGGTPHIGGHNQALTGWADLIFQRDGGNVGISTQTPTAKLDVRGTIRGDAISISGTTVIDGSRNLTNIGTIGSGAITCTTIDTQSNTITAGAVNSSSFYTTGNSVINNGSPTIIFQDTDNRSAMIHCNANLLYILRGSGNNSTSWTTTNGVWPCYWNLENNNQYAGGDVHIIGDARSFRQNSTGTWGGDPGTGVGKIEYHSNRWYIVSGSDSAECLRIRRNATDVFAIDNSGIVTTGNVPWGRLSSVPSASTSVAGIVQLNNATNSTSTTQAATANAVKLANDNANGRAPSNQTMHIGTTPVAINRPSGALSLTGVSIDGTSGSVGGISANNLFNNMGANHGDRTDFNTIPNFGTYYVTGNTNGPGVNSATQYYAITLGLGANYPWSGSGSYGVQIAIPRAVSNPYIAIRYNENNSLAAWQRISAGYADSAGSVSQTLTRGSYLTGANYNGSTATTWAVDATEAATGSKIVARDSSADITCRLVRSNYTNQTTISGAMAYRVNTSDNYIRFCSDTGAIRTFLSVPPTSRNIATGNGLSGGGNLSADRTLTIDTGVVVTLTDAQTITGVKTFNSTITGSITGSAASATNATNATNINITNETTNASRSVAFVGGTGNQPTYITNTKLIFNPSTGALSVNKSSSTNATLDVNGVVRGSYFSSWHWEIKRYSNYVSDVNSNTAQLYNITYSSTATVSYLLTDTYNINTSGYFDGNALFGDVHNYVAVITTNIYVKRGFSVTNVTLNGDDPYALFINSAYITGANVCCGGVTYSYTFTVGWHKIELIYSESGGGHYGQLGWNPKDYTDFIAVMTPYGPMDMYNNLLTYRLNNIGIGNTAPSQKLHVTGNTRIDGIQFVNNGDSSYTEYGPNTTWASYLRVGAAGNIAGSSIAQVISTNGNLHLDNATSRTMYLNNYVSGNILTNLAGGNFAIGTASPDQRLTVRTDVDGANYINSRNASSGTSAHAGMYIQSNGGACYWFLNSTTRTGDGGVNTATIRNDAGPLRLQSTGANGITIASTTGNATFSGSITSGGITCTTINTQNNTVTVGSGTVTAGTYQISGTTVIDTSRNLTNIGTIGCGAITCTSINTQNNNINAGSGTISSGIISTGSMYRMFDTRAIAPNALGAGYISFGFGSWNNNSVSPFADTMHFNTWNDSSGGNQNIIAVRKDTHGMRLYQGAFGSSSAYSSYVDVLTTQANSANVTLSGSLTCTSINTQNNNITVGSGTVTAATFSGNATNATNANNATTAGGLAVHTGTNNEANKIVRTDGNGYINAGWINSISGDNGNTVPSRFYSSHDQFIRFHTRNTYKMHIGLTAKYDRGRVQDTTDTNYWTGAMGWGTTDWNTVGTWGSGFVDSWSSPGNRPGDGQSHHVGIQTFHYTAGDNNAYGWQMVGGPSATWSVRHAWGTWSAWYTLLHSGNYNSYSPTLTGGNASGNWNINAAGLYNSPNISVGTINSGAITTSNKITISTPGSYDGETFEIRASAEPTNYRLYMNSVVTSGVVRWVFNQVNAGTSYTNLLTFDRGKIGINQTTPEAPLHITATGNTSPNNNALYVYNPTNSANQHAIVSMRVAGSSGGNPFISWDIAGEYGWSMGIDNADGNKLKVARSWSSLTTSVAMTIDSNARIDTFGDFSFSGTLQGGSIPVARITGTLPVANGGTGTTSVTGSGSVVYSASPTLTGTLSAATISASGTITLTGNGTFYRQNNTTSWGGDTGAGWGKMEYHNGRWYIVSASDSSDCVIFRRGSTNLVTISNSGGITCPAIAFTASINCVGNAELQSVSINGTSILDINRNMTNIASINCLGTIYAAGDITALSDKTHKTNIRVIDDALSKLHKISGYTFQFKEDPTEKYHAGLLAQEVQDVLPEVVTQNSSDGSLGLAYGNVISLVVNAVKELDDKVEPKHSTQVTDLIGSIIYISEFKEEKPVLSLTNKPNDKRVYGIVTSKMEKQNTQLCSIYEKDCIVKTKGFVSIWVTNINGDMIEQGDYITSSKLPGYGMCQGTTVFNNFTIGKSIVDIDFTDASLEDRYKVRYLSSSGLDIPKEEFKFDRSYIAVLIPCSI